MNFGNARRALGMDFISHTEVSEEQLNHASYTREDRVHLNGWHIRQGNFEWCFKNGYLLLPGPPSFEDPETFESRRPMIRDLVDMGIDMDSNVFTHIDKWRFDLLLKPWAQVSLSVGWIMMRKEMVTQTCDVNQKSGEQMLSVIEAVPNAAMLVWALLLWKKVRNADLLRPHQFARSASLAEDGRRVLVGVNAQGLIRLELFEDEKSAPNIGILPIRF